MTPVEIQNRLKAEFPNRHVCFSLEVTSPRYASSDNWIEMSIYTADGDGGQTSIPCTSFEEGIASLKAKLGLVIPEMELTV